MTDQSLLQRYRQFLLILAGFIFVGVIVELYFTGHTDTPIQYIPFMLSGLGLVALAAVLIRPQRTTFLVLRGVMGLVTLGSFLGIYEHIANNLAFALEIQPNATVREGLFNALGGASPLLAPGILALGALLAFAATYYHPALTKA